MNEIKDRLVGCFQTVFASLPESEIETASQATVAAWDSVAAIMLVNVIEDEFQVELDLEILPELNSFPRVLEHVTQLKTS